MARNNQGGNGSQQQQTQSKRKQHRGHQPGDRVVKRHKRTGTGIARRNEGTFYQELESEREAARQQAQAVFRQAQASYALGSLRLPADDPEKELIELSIAAFVDVQVPPDTSRTKAAINKALEHLGIAEISRDAERTVHGALKLGYNSAAEAAQREAHVA